MSVNPESFCVGDRVSVEFVIHNIEGDDLVLHPVKGDDDTMILGSTLVDHTFFTPAHVFIGRGNPSIVSHTALESV